MALTASAAATAMLLLTAPAAVAGSHQEKERPADAAGDPPGNNGTVKVDGQPFDTHPDNEPHVGCVFQIDFYGYDEIDEPATVIFAAQSPTGAGEELARHSVDHGEDPHDGGGSEAGLDAELTVDLTGALSAYEPHPQQGYHVKLTVHAPGSQGADTKHKVFWVEPCDGEVGAAGAERDETSVDRAAGRRTGAGGARAARDRDGRQVAAGQRVTAGQSEGQVLGLVEERAQAQAATAGAANDSSDDRARVMGLTLARTGAGLGALAAVAAGLIALGTLLVKRGRLGNLRGRR